MVGRLYNDLSIANGEAGGGVEAWHIGVGWAIMPNLNARMAWECC